MEEKNRIFFHDNYFRLSSCHLLLFALFEAQAGKRISLTTSGTGITVKPTGIPESHCFTRLLTSISSKP